MTEVLLLAVTMVLYRERVVRQRLRLTYSSVLDALKIKIMEIASRLSFFRQDIPIVGSIAYAGWKESSRKCLSHKTLCLDGPFQRRVFSSPYLPNPPLPTAVIARELKEVDGVTAGTFTSRCNTINNRLVYD